MKLLLRLMQAWLLLGVHMSSSADFLEGLDAAQRGDFQTAMREWRPLAEQGDASAQFNLGVMYANGRGVPEDDREAVKWYRKAAEQGDASAQYNLGVMYDNGSGVPEDDVLAYMWWNLAAASGHKNSKKNRDSIRKEMSRSQITEAQRLSREWRPLKERK